MDDVLAGGDGRYLEHVDATGRLHRIGLVVVALALLAFGPRCSADSEPAPPRGDGARPPFDSSPTWSPDGTRLAFTRGADETLRLVDVRSGGTRFLSNGVGFGGGSLWSRDGSRLAYVRSADRTLRVADLASGRSVELLDGVTGLARRAWSPDQRSLVVTSKRDDTRSKRCWGQDGICTELYVVGAAGGPPRRLTDNLTYEKEPVWSPDGKWIAYLSGHEPDDGFRNWRDVRVVSLDGRERAMTNDGPVEWWVGWEREGVLLIERDDGTRFTLSLDGKRRSLPPVPNTPFVAKAPSEHSPADGTLAYLSTRDRNGRECWEGSGSDRGGCATNSELYLRLPIGRRVRITHSRVDEDGLAWSPDGRMLAFESGGRLMLVDADGRRLRALTRWTGEQE
jgi:Tol biopolymer transport system component